MIIQSYSPISKVIVFFFKNQFEELKIHQIKKNQYISERQNLLHLRIHYKNQYTSTYARVKMQFSVDVHV